MVTERITETKFNDLQDEHNALEINYNELKIKYDESIRKKDYKLWNANDLVDWIVAVHESRYSKYKDVLLRIDGTCLRDLDKNDLYYLGIESFKDRAEIYKKIQELISKQTHDEQAKQQEGQ